jgi:hypothetical protein
MRQTAVQLVETGEVLVSQHRHDYVSATTPSGKMFFLDGGPDSGYIRYGGDAQIIALHLDDSSDIDTIANKAVWGTYGKDGKGPKKFIRLCMADTDHLKAILDTQKISKELRDAIKLLLKQRKKRK